ncbi:hypothetical protein Ancab_021009 [Ancistrocladus abbreviatus]
MVFKTSCLFFIVLSLSALLLVSLEFFNHLSYSSSLINKDNRINIDNDNSVVYSLPSPPHLINRKVLVSKTTLFDFTPFYKQQRRHRSHHHRHYRKREPNKGETDPGYDDDKRKVPTGPNPLHH